MSAKEIQAYSIRSLLVSFFLVFSGLLLYFRGNLPAYEGPGLTLLFLSAAALGGYSVLCLACRRRLSEWTEPCDPSPLMHRSMRHPFLTLFIISFASLFVEIMLIRYTSAQIRIFSFYKNIPLIGAFLGLGLGCCLGKGNPAHALRFLLWLVPVAVFLSQGTLAVGGNLSILGSIGSSEHILGDAPDAALAGYRAVAQFVMGLFCVATLIIITILFSLLGRFLGDAFQQVPRLSGYTVNILGSLAGTVLFFAMSYLNTPPWAWFLCGLVPLLWWLPTRRYYVLGTALIVLSSIAAAPQYGDTVWSSYQKLVGHRLAVKDAPDAYLVKISDVFYQIAADLRPGSVSRSSWPELAHYQQALKGIPSLDRVLVVGAGTGNDVAAALRAGARRVDAVDIDPAIVSMGQTHHPEQPYSDPRVSIIVDDARAAFRKLPPRSYDAVVFGLLDSHTQLGMSSVRLDNYVFTVESFAEATRLLKTGGHLVVTAATLRNWFRDRLRALMDVTCNNTVEQATVGPWTTYTCTVASSDKDSLLASLPTDDWPFLYLPSRAIPTAYLVVVAMLVVTSILTLKKQGLVLERFNSYHGHLFFLGAAFLLMEVSAINRLALLWGSTWVVSAVTIICVLVLIVTANVTIAASGSMSYWLVYAALFLTLGASYVVQPETVLGKPLVYNLSYGLLALSPVYFAGLVFARSFRDARDARTAMGANILGAVLGGWFEYSTMVFGIQAMVLVAGSFYLLSLLCLLRSRMRLSPGT